MQKRRQMGAEMKYTTVSGLSVLLVLLLHLIHWFSAPLLMGAMEMHGQHHHGMMHDASASMELLTWVLLIINGTGMFFAVRQLAMAWKKRKGGLHTYLCCTVSVAMLGIGIYSFMSI
ncbi:hypothetical protein [Paenibacillus naphthalenovorans]|uniref:Uncharacterized protein n=1 Tax=Paenibacillus naphthalenovorans TaxID=162209 RepID=A0A0U2MUN5_9BACL|nr:hypothetical protein [Paenibacillus naphthalenovorans]ALS21199.1 hypothetical protein IJ22_08170 [Paenibacillus naphthalenovorans]